MKQWGADKPQDQRFHSGSMQQNVSSSHFREILNYLENPIAFSEI